MKKERTAVEGRNNNKDEIYFSIPDYHITKKLDFITLSIFRDDHLKQMGGFLEANGFKVASDLKMTEGNYDMKRTYESKTDAASVEIMHGIKIGLTCYPSLLIKIHDGNKQFFYLLDSFFKYHNIETKVSVIEMTFDFHTDAPIKLFDILKSCLFQKNIRMKPQKGYATTFYTTNIRKNSKGKGMRCYIKKLAVNDIAVRMELDLGRNVIRELGLVFPLSNIDSLDLSKFFLYKFINVDRIMEYLHWKYRDQIAGAEKKQIGGLGGALVKAHLNSIMNCIIDRDESLMDNVYVLKSSKIDDSNYSRFIEPLECFNSDFFTIASCDSFVPDKPKFLPASENGSESIYVLKN